MIDRLIDGRDGGGTGLRVVGQRSGGEREEERRGGGGVAMMNGTRPSDEEGGKQQGQGQDRKNQTERKEAKEGMN